MHLTTQTSRRDVAGRGSPETSKSSTQVWAERYGTAILPARPRKPQDKVEVEFEFEFEFGVGVGVQAVERWLLARLRNQVFFTHAALNR